MSELVELLKQVAVNAVATTYPTEIRYGKVVRTSPIEVKLSEKMILDSKFLIIGERFKEYSGWINVDGEAKRVTMHNSLGLGDTVTLLRVQGGQKFVIQDRVHRSSRLRLVGTADEMKIMIEALRELTDQSLAYNLDSGEVIFGEKPNKGTDKPIGTELIADLINGDFEVRVTDLTGKTNQNGFLFKDDITLAENDDWINPNNATVYLKLKEDKGKNDPLKIRMGHELIHALRFTRGESKFKGDDSEEGHYYDENNDRDGSDGKRVFDTARVEELEVTGIPYYKEHPSAPEQKFDVEEGRMTENVLRIEQSKEGNELPRRTGY